MKTALSVFLSAWSIISICTYLIIILSLASSDLERLLTLIGFICNLVIIFVGMFFVIWDVFFTKYLSKFTRTFGLMTIFAFLFTTILSFIEPLRDSNLGILGVTLLWFMGVFLLIYTTTRTVKEPAKPKQRSKKSKK